MKGATKSLGKKDNLDRFYTKPEVAAQLIKEINLEQYDSIIEPSAGCGAFSLQIPNCLALDLAPAHPSILQKNFFDFSTDEGNILVIGNPPFGEQSKLAIQFFNHAATFARTIAFILPKSFRKISIQNRLDLHFHLLNEIELSDNSFLLNEEDYAVPCVFQIWERKNTKRKKVKAPSTSQYFSFVKTKEEADLRVQRVGGNAGKAYLNKEGALSSNYYLKNTSPYTTEELVRLLNTANYHSLEDTVGPKSLPKGELILESNKILKGDTL